MEKQQDQSEALDLSKLKQLQQILHGKAHKSRSLCATLDVDKPMLVKLAEQVCFTVEENVWPSLAYDQDFNDLILSNDQVRAQVQQNLLLLLLYSQKPEVLFKKWRDIISKVFVDEQNNELPDLKSLILFVATHDQNRALLRLVPQQTLINFLCAQAQYENPIDPALFDVFIQQRLIAGLPCYVPHTLRPKDTDDTYKDTDDTYKGAGRHHPVLIAQVKVTYHAWLREHVKIMPATSEEECLLALELIIKNDATITQEDLLKLTHHSSVACAMLDHLAIFKRFLSDPTVFKTIATLHLDFAAKAIILHNKKQLNLPEIPALANTLEEPLETLVTQRHNYTAEEQHFIRARLLARCVSGQDCLMLLTDEKYWQKNSVFYLRILQTQYKQGHLVAGLKLANQIFLGLGTIANPQLACEIYLDITKRDPKTLSPLTLMRVIDFYLPQAQAHFKDAEVLLEQYFPHYEGSTRPLSEQEKAPLMHSLDTHLGGSSVTFFAPYNKPKHHKTDPALSKKLDYALSSTWNALEKITRICPADNNRFQDHIGLQEGHALMLRYLIQFAHYIDIEANSRTELIKNALRHAWHIDQHSDGIIDHALVSVVNNIKEMPGDLADVVSEISQDMEKKTL